MGKLKVLDLFSGIGGFSLGLERTGGFETVAFCEIDPFCQKVLKKHWPHVPIYNDVRTLNYDGAVDVITGGFPCQPFSLAGKRKGAADDRHLWPAMFNLVKKYRPAWVIGENTYGLFGMGLDEVLSDLESADYTSRTFCIPAVSLGADHARERLWPIAHANDQRKEASGRQGNDGSAKLASRGMVQKYIHSFEKLACGIGWAKTATESGIPRVHDGISDRVDRNHALGNAVVPQIPELIGYAILEASRA